jgi:hypothetical protein
MCLLEADEFVDATILLSNSGKSHRVHRVIVSRLSPFLAAAFKRSWREMNSGVVMLDLPEAVEPYFPLALRFLYGSKIALNSANVVPVLTLADILLIAPLHTHCLSYIAVSVHSSASDLCGILASAHRLESDLVIDVCAAAAVDERSGWPLLIAASDAELGDVPLELWLCILERVAHRTIRSLRAHASAFALRQLQAMCAAGTDDGPAASPSLALMLPSEMAAARAASTASGGVGVAEDGTPYSSPSLSGPVGSAAALVSAAVARHLMLARDSNAAAGPAAAGAARQQATAEGAADGRSRWALQALLRTAGAAGTASPDGVQIPAPAAPGALRGRARSAGTSAAEPLWFGGMQTAAAALTDEAEAELGGSPAPAAGTGRRWRGRGRASATGDDQRQQREEEARLLQRRRELSLMLLRLLRSSLLQEQAALEAARTPAAAAGAGRAGPAAATAGLPKQRASELGSRRPTFGPFARAVLHWLQTMSPLLEVAATFPILNGTAAWGLSRIMASVLVAEAVQAQFGGALGLPAGVGDTSSPAGGRSGLASAAGSGAPWISESRRIAWLREALPSLRPLQLALDRMAPVAAASFGSLPLRLHARAALLHSAGVRAATSATARFSGRPRAPARGPFQQTEGAPQGGARAVPQLTDGDAGEGAPAQQPEAATEAAASPAVERSASAEEAEEAEGGVDGASGLLESPLPDWVPRESSTALRAEAVTQALGAFALQLLGCEELRCEHEDDVAAFCLDIICDLWLTEAAAAEAVSSRPLTEPPRAAPPDPSARWRAFTHERAQQLTRGLWSAVRWEYTSDAALAAAVSAVLALRHDVTSRQAPEAAAADGLGGEASRAAGGTRGAPPEDGHILGGAGTFDSPFVAAGDPIPASGPGLAASAFPVPHGPYAKLLVDGDAGAAEALAFAAANGTQARTPTAGGGVMGDKFTAEARGTEEAGEEEDEGVIGVTDRDIENARYRHRLAGLVASPAAAVAIGLLPPRLSYASRHRPMLSAPSGSPRGAAGRGSSALGDRAPRAALAEAQRLLLTDAEGPRRTSSMRRLQEEGPLALHGASNTAAAAASVAASPAASAVVAGAAEPAAATAASPAAEQSSVQRAVVFGRHAVAFGAWPPAARPLLTNWAQNPVRPPAVAAAGTVGSPAPGEPQTQEGPTSAHGARLLRLRARSQAAAAASENGPARGDELALQTPMLLPAVPFDELRLEEEGFSLGAAAPAPAFEEAVADAEASTSGASGSSRPSDH